MNKPIPVVDLFAGPGGLGEGFSSLIDEYHKQIFDVRVSIEKDPIAHRTLSLRALFRRFPKDGAPDCYYDYVRGNITMRDLLAHPSIQAYAPDAFDEARHATLGETPQHEVDLWIKNAIGDSNTWVLIGGPPCQAYSLAGRSRMRGANPEAFEKDGRHFLYKEYLRIIRRFCPAAFVMENVKGMLSSTHGGLPIFERIIDDLSKPETNLEYDIRSFMVNGHGNTIKPHDFVIEAERFGVPQMRHRVILFGIRRDLSGVKHGLILPAGNLRVSVLQAISGLPPLRGRLSKEQDSFHAWRGAIREAARNLLGWNTEQVRSKIERLMHEAWSQSIRHESTGSRFVSGDCKPDLSIPALLRAWYYDPKLGGASLHETRKHMRSDLHRYLFASCYAAEFKYSPRLSHFPESLLPEHCNVDDENVPFIDRFRVQLGHQPSTTVVSHIAKDGHYYIHPDPSQCRSLTVREAARLQTFPDNYFFEGNRTQQYTQVGNAVPPYLAQQIAKVVFDFLKRAATDQQRDCA